MKRGKQQERKDRSIEPAVAAASVLLLARLCLPLGACVLACLLSFSLRGFRSVGQRGPSTRGAANDGESPDHGSLRRYPGDQEDSPWPRNRDESEESANREHYYTSQHPNRWQDHLYISFSGILTFCDSSLCFFFFFYDRMLSIMFRDLLS